MSKENDKKYTNIEDPLASLGFDETAEDGEEIVEKAEEIIGGTDEVQAADFEKKPSALSAAKEKAAEILKPAADVASKKLTLKTSAIIVGAVLVLAIGLSVLFFSLYSNAVYTSQRSVEDWAKEWNEMEYTDNCKYLYEEFVTLNMGTMLNSDTDHVRLTDEDIKALSKGETIKILDDFAELSVETEKGDFKSASLKIDYTKMCKYYYGENYMSDSSLMTYNYMPAPNHDVPARVLTYMGLIMNPLNDTVNTDSEAFTVAVSLNMNSAYTMPATATYGDYTYTFSYNIEQFLNVVSNSDASGSDISVTDMSASVEPHYIYYITSSYNKSGQKKHQADWSWWTDMFPKKEESSVDDISGQLSASDASASDVSASDISATDK